MFEICVEHTFSAGHALRNYHGKCENVHGHNYRVQVGVEGPGIGRDRAVAGFCGPEETAARDQRISGPSFINDLKPFDEINPSAENIATIYLQ